VSSWLGPASSLDTQREGIAETDRRKHRHDDCEGRRTVVHALDEQRHHGDGADAGNGDPGDEGGWEATVATVVRDSAPGEKVCKVRVQHPAQETPEGELHPVVPKVA
jgi:hypothetical protein